MSNRTHHTIPFILLLMLLVIPCCVEPFNPEIDRYERVLVVDGSFSNGDDDQYVRISRTYGYYELESGMEAGAVVSVEDDLGNVGVYKEKDLGLYRLEKGTFPGVVGRSYRLSIVTKDGKQYGTDFIELKPSVDIDSVYYEIKEADPENTGYFENGVQLYLDSKDETGNGKYYRWEYTETWEFTVPFNKPGYESFRKCWRETNSKSIMIANTTQLSEDYNYRQKINFVPFTSYRLSRLYSVMIRQYSLPEEAFDFWRKLEINNEYTGSLFDPPPTPVTGNIENVDDPYEPVLGYFQVAGLTEKRIFIERDELPKAYYIASGNEHCEGLTVMGHGEHELNTGWYLLEQYYLFDTIWTSMSNYIDCYDCRVRGSDDMPEYWIETDE